MTRPVRSGFRNAGASRGGRPPLARARSGAVLAFAALACAAALPGCVAPQMALLRSGHMSVTDVCIAVGFTSLGSFSSTFTRLVGEPPSAYKARDPSRLAPVPPCMTRAWARPGWIAQPCRIGEAFLAGRA